MRYSKQLAVGASVAFVCVFLFVSYLAESGFNPYPQTTTLSATICTAGSGRCPGFEIDSARLSIHYFQDITSQQLVVTITPTGSAPMQSVGVYFDSVPLGVVQGPFEPGATATVNATVPTTFTLVTGSTHQVVLEGIYAGVAGGLSETYWDSTPVTVQ